MVEIVRKEKFGNSVIVLFGVNFLCFLNGSCMWKYIVV